MIVVLDFENIKSKEEFYNYLNNTFKFEEYVNNLDFLYDQLCCFLEEIEIQIINVNVLKEVLDNSFKGFINLLDDVNEECENIKIVIK